MASPVVPMPITIPPSTAYQAPMVPVSSRWNKAPPEGPKFIACEVDWGITTPPGQAVQFSLNAGPLEFSQICAFSVDNSRCGSDVSFIFPDTGRQLTVPALASGVYPVFTNSLTFYLLGMAANVGDVTEFEILNTTPPPVSVLPSEEQSHAGTANIDLGTNAFTQIIPTGTTGTIQTIAATVHEYNPTAGTVVAALTLLDGTGAALWQTTITIAANTSATVPIVVPGLRLRFVNGLRLQVSSSTIPVGNTGVVINLFYSVP